MPWRAESGQTQIQVVPGSMGSRDQGSETTGGAGCLPGVRLPPRGQVASQGSGLWLGPLAGWTRGGGGMFPAERNPRRKADTESRRHTVSRREESSLTLLKPGLA